MRRQQALVAVAGALLEQVLQPARARGRCLVRRGRHRHRRPSAVLHRPARRGRWRRGVGRRRWRRHHAGRLTAGDATIAEDVELGGAIIALPTRAHPHVQRLRLRVCHRRAAQLRERAAHAHHRGRLRALRDRIGATVDSGGGGDDVAAAHHSRRGRRLERRAQPRQLQIFCGKSCAVVVTGRGAGSSAGVHGRRRHRGDSSWRGGLARVAHGRWYGLTARRPAVRRRLWRPRAR